MGKYSVLISGVDSNNLISLTNDEMKKLFVLVANNDEYARELLIEGNLRLVLSILKRFYNHNENLDDLFQVGCIGLVKAIDYFDLSYDVKFSTYAVPMILGEIKRYIRDNSTIRVSRSLKDIGYKALKISNEFLSSNGYNPSTKYIADVLEVSELEVANALCALKDPVSMYEVVYDDGGDTIYLYDQIEDKSASINVEQFGVEDAINGLAKREKYVLEERYTMGHTQDEVAASLGISQAQVSRIETGAIKKLKKVLN